MQNVYRFVGTESVVGNIKMTRFGQRFGIDSELAESAQAGGCALIEETDFNSLGFTTEELKIWADPFMSITDVPDNKEDAKAKAEYLRKREAAQAYYCEVRQGLLEPHERHVVEVPVVVKEGTSITEITDGGE